MRTNARSRRWGTSLARSFVAVALVACGGTTTSEPGDGGAGGGGGSGGQGGAPADGGQDGAGPCVVDGDCGADRICGFPVAAACAATGSCFPAPGATCQAYSPGCACDGSVINLVCNGLPSGWAPRPLAHAGACTDGDAAPDGCVSVGICLSTLDCVGDSDCASLGSRCDTCSHLCGCGVPDAGGTFACGPTLTCASGAEWCKVGVGGAAGMPPSYSCQTLPAGCLHDDTCACVEAAVGGQLCTDTPGVTVTFEYP